MEILKFDEIDSTSKYLKNIISTENEKYKGNFPVIVAKSQTSGKGRRGNEWSSEEGGAYFSFTLKEDKNIDFNEYMKLPLVLGYSLMNTLERIEPSLKIDFKWTNDIYINDKKISGILVEKKENYFVIGIGINLNNKIKGNGIGKGISLSSITQKKYNIMEIIISVIENFKKDFDYYISGNWENILLKLNKKNYLYNKKIKISFGNEQEDGIAKYISKTGELVVEINNKERFFNIGEIHISK